VRLRLALLVVLALTLGGSGGGTAPQPLAIGHASGNIQDPVEQLSPDWDYASNVYNMWRCTHDGTEQDMADGTGTEHADSCVHNPTRCVWDDDDHDLSAGSGYLATGATTRATICSIADGADNTGGDDKTAEAWVYSPQRTLAVTMTDTRGHSWTAVPIANKNGWDYLICIREQEPGPFPLIDGSNGGTGIRIDYTLTVTASRKTNGIAAYLQTWGFVRDLLTPCPNVYWPGH